MTLKSVRSLLSKICGEKSVEECERAVDEWIRKVGKAAAPAEAKKESEKAAAATEAKKEAEKAAAATKATVRPSPLRPSSAFTGDSGGSSKYLKEYRIQSHL